MAPGAATANSVRVVPVSGPDQVIALADLAGREDVRDRPYTLRSASGEREQAVTGFSVGKVLAEAGIPASGFDYAEVNGPNGKSVLLTREQAAGSDAFDEGPPVVYVEGQATSFLRPTLGAGDLNAADCFRADSGAITINLRSDQALTVRITASSTRIQPGGTVSFTAHASGASGHRVAFGWDFADGARGDGRAATHRFARKGSFLVRLTATADGGARTAYDMIRVDVGMPAGKSKGKKEPKGDEPRRRERRGDRSDPGPATGGPGDSSTGQGGPGSDGPGPDPTDEGRDRPRRKAAPEPARPRTLVTGQLLGPGSASGPELDPNEAPPPEASEKKGKLPLPEEAAGILGIAGLLLSGFALESRAITGRGR